MISISDYTDYLLFLIGCANAPNEYLESQHVWCLSFMLVHFLCRYLTEDQLRGPSSIEGYIRALMDGCRCVECMYLLRKKVHWFASKKYVVFNLTLLTDWKSLRSCIWVNLSANGPFPLNWQQPISDHMTAIRINHWLTFIHTSWSCLPFICERTTPITDFSSIKASHKNTFT